MDAKKPTVISTSLQDSLSMIFSLISGKYFFLSVSLMEHTSNPAFEALSFGPL